VPRVLFDVNVPRPASRFLSHHTVELADRRGWRELSNGELLAAAEGAGFDVLLTADRNLRYQQNLTGRRIAIVALSTNRWAIVRAHQDLLTDAVDRARPGTYEEVVFPRARLRRRQAPGRSP
jgi:hypothetical protein